ncbi:MAG: hypothetical protein WAT09_02845 [Paracoccaceae bacterium]
MDPAVTDGVNWAGLLMMAGLVVLFALMAWFLVIKPDRINSKGLAAMAQRRGWALTRTVARLGRGSKIRLVPQDGGGWSCVVTRYSRMEGGGTIRTTEFESPRALLPQGMVLIGPAIADASARTAEKMLSQMGGMLEEMLLKKLLGADAAAEGAGLRLVADAAPGVTVFATTGTPAAELTQMFVPLTADWRTTYRDQQMFPILIATPARTRLRLRVDASNPAMLEAFVDTAVLLHEAGPGIIRQRAR